MEETNSEVHLQCLVPDSDLDELSDEEGWDLITALPALRKPPIKYLEENNTDASKMSKNKRENLFPVDTTTESEGENVEPGAVLVCDTVSSDVGSSHSSDANVTVVEKKTDKPSGTQAFETHAEESKELLKFDQPTLIPETMESVDDFLDSPHVFDKPESASPEPDSASSKGTCGEPGIFRPESGGTMMSQAQIDTGESQNFCLRWSPSQSTSTEAKVSDEANIEEGLVIDAAKQSSSPAASKKLSLKDALQNSHVTTISKSVIQLPTLNTDHSEDLSEESPRVGTEMKFAHSTPKALIDTKSPWKQASSRQSYALFTDCTQESSPLENIDFLDKPVNVSDDKPDDEVVVEKSVTEAQTSMEKENEQTLSYEYLKSFGQQQSANEDDDEILIDPTPQQTSVANTKASGSKSSQRELENGGDLFEKENEVTVVDVGDVRAERESQRGDQSMTKHSDPFRMSGKLEEVVVTSLSKFQCDTVIDDPLAKPGGENDEDMDVDLIETGVDLGAQNVGDDEVVINPAGYSQSLDAAKRILKSQPIVQSAPKPIDQYTFRGTQSQNFADVSAFPVSEGGALQSRGTKNVRMMKKVIKKRAEPKNDRSSSSVDESKGSELRKPTVKPKGKNLKKKETTLMLPPPSEATSSSLAVTHNSETLPVQESKAGPSTSKSQEPAARPPRKTISFNDDLQSKDSESRQYSMERTTVKEVMAIVVTRETSVDLLDSKGNVLKHTLKTEVIRRTVIEPCHSEVEVYEKMLSPVVSPSRSVSTLTSGDLADVSNSSFSRSNSLGSKSSNPSLDAAAQSYPTPAQRKLSMEETEENVPTVADLITNTTTAAYSSSTAVAMSAAAPEVTMIESNQRLSTGSATGQDLFSTPDKLVIVSSHSHHGKAVSSLQNTPTSFTESTTNQTALQSKDKTPPVKAASNSKSLSSQKQFAKEDSEGGGQDENADDWQQMEESSKRNGAKRGLRGTKRKAQEKPTPQKSFKDNKGRGRKSRNQESESKDQPMEKASCSKATAGKDDDVNRSGVSTGFSLQAAGSHNSAKANVSQPSSGVFSPEISLQGAAGSSSTGKGIIPDITSSLCVGKQVMAKWKDSFFYPGTLNKIETANDRYHVKFDDGSSGWVRSHGLLLAQELPVGHSVMVFGDDGYYECAMIMKHTLDSQSTEEHPKVIYHVEKDDGTKLMCERKSLLLSEDQAACLASDESIAVPDLHAIEAHVKPGDISLDNLVEGKRRKKVKEARPDSPNTSASAKPGGSAKKDANSSSALKTTPMATSTPTPKHGSKSGKSKAAASPGKKSSLDLLSGVLSSPAEKRASPRVARAYLFASNPSPRPDLFAGMAFLFTHINKSKEQIAEEKQLMYDSSMDTSADDEDDIDRPPFNKEHLQMLIRTGGGEVLAEFDEEKIRASKQCLVIASEHQRTVKYLQGLAADLKIVSHLWVIHSAAQSKVLGLKAYLLPAGISLQVKRLVESKGICSDLAGQTIMIVSSNEDFVQSWKSVVSVAKCHTVTRFPSRANKNDPGVDLVVSDKTCPQTMVRRCQQLEVPLVSGEWVAQCLINGRMVDSKSNERYRHNYRE